MLPLLIFYWQKTGRVAFCFEMQQSTSASLSRPWLPSLRFGDKSGKGRAVGEAPAAGSHFCLAAPALTSKTMGDGWWRPVANEEKVGLKAQAPNGKWNWGGGVRVEMYCADAAPRLGWQQVLVTCRGGLIQLQVKAYNLGVEKVFWCRPDVTWRNCSVEVPGMRNVALA